MGGDSAVHDLGMEKEEGKSIDKRNGFRCIHCGCRVNMLFVQYSPGNIRLMKCENCKVTADEYIECEIMILLVDLILHKRKAYRHLLHNAITLGSFDFQGILWKSAFLYLLLDAYRILLLRDDRGQSLSSFSSVSIGKMFMDVLVVNFAFICVLLLGARNLVISSSRVVSYKDILLAIILSSYFKIFLIATMVWDFPSSVLFIVNLLVLSSNAVALKVAMTEELRASTKCVWVCLAAHAVKFFLANLMAEGRMVLQS